MLNILKQFHFLKNKIQRGIFVGLLIFIVLVSLFLLGLFSTFQNKLSDTLYKQQGTPNNIALIAIDDKSIQEIGRFPWDREVYANLLNKLDKSQSTPKVIGFDISFLEKSNNKSDADLASAIKAYKNTRIVLAGEISGNETLNPIASLKDVSQTGYVNTNPDSDGVLRKMPNSKIDGINSFATEITGTPLRSASFEGQVNFIGKPGSFTTYSFSDVINGKVDPKTFDGKIILIGATAADLHDEESVPVAPKMNGVEIQANIIFTHLTSSGKKQEAQIISILTILIIAILLSVAFVYLPPVGVISVSIVTAIIYIFYVIFSFDSGVIRNIVYPIIAIIISAIANIIYKYFTESKAKKFLRQTFSYYLSESVLNHLLDHPEKIKLGGERKELTVLFSDIASFTSISEKLKPEDLANLLNDYLTKMTDVIFNNRGVLDKYIGDAIMAFWGAPVDEKDHAYLACKTALAMQEAIAKNFDFTARVGINTGEMVVGNMGSNQRFDYSLLGDNVNLGSRLEGINKYYGTKICISESTFQKVSERIVARKLDIVAVKGKSKGVPIYELIAIGVPKKTTQNFLEEFENARSFYEEGKFKKALKLFIDFNKKNKGDAPTLMYIDRIKELIKNPPEAWDGVYHATGK